MTPAMQAGPQWVGLSLSSNYFSISYEKLAKIGFDAFYLLIQLLQQNMISEYLPQIVSVSLDTPCDVCFESYSRVTDLNDQNSFPIKCRSCLMSSHRYCYIADPFPRFQCDPCRGQIKNTNLCCLFCGNKGYFKLFNNYLYGHPICLLTSPDIYPRNYRIFEFQRIAEFKLKPMDDSKCEICEKNGNYAVKCAQVGCQRIAHVYCALKNTNEQSWLSIMANSEHNRKINYQLKLHFIAAKMKVHDLLRDKLQSKRWIVCPQHRNRHIAVCNCQTERPEQPVKCQKCLNLFHPSCVKFNSKGMCEMCHTWTSYKTNIFRQEGLSNYHIKLPKMKIYDYISMHSINQIYPGSIHSELLEWNPFCPLTDDNTSLSLLVEYLFKRVLRSNNRIEGLLCDHACQSIIVDLLKEQQVVRINFFIAEKKSIEVEPSLSNFKVSLLSLIDMNGLDEKTQHCLLNTLELLEKYCQIKEAVLAMKPILDELIFKINSGLKKQCQAWEFATYFTEISDKYPQYSSNLNLLFNNVYFPCSVEQHSSYQQLRTKLISIIIKHQQSKTRVTKSQFADLASQYNSLHEKYRRSCKIEYKYIIENGLIQDRFENALEAYLSKHSFVTISQYQRYSQKYPENKMTVQYENIQKAIKLFLDCNWALKQKTERCAVKLATILQNSAIQPDSHFLDKFSRFVKSCEHIKMTYKAISNRFSIQADMCQILKNNPASYQVKYTYKLLWLLKQFGIEEIISDAKIVNIAKLILAKHLDQEQNYIQVCQRLSLLRTYRVTQVAVNRDIYKWHYQYRPQINKLLVSQFQNIGNYQSARLMLEEAEIKICRIDNFQFLAYRIKTMWLWLLITRDISLMMDDVNNFQKIKKYHRLVQELNYPANKYRSWIDYAMKSVTVLDNLTGHWRYLTDIQDKKMEIEELVQIELTLEKFEKQFELGELYVVYALLDQFVVHLSGMLRGIHQKDAQKVETQLCWFSGHSKINIKNSCLYEKVLPLIQQNKEFDLQSIIDNTFEMFACIGKIKKFNGLLESTTRQIQLSKQIDGYSGRILLENRCEYVRIKRYFILILTGSQSGIVVEELSENYTKFERMVEKVHYQILELYRSSMSSYKEYEKLFYPFLEKYQQKIPLLESEIFQIQKIYKEVSKGSVTSLILKQLNTQMISYQELYRKIPNINRYLGTLKKLENLHECFHTFDLSQMRCQSFVKFEKTFRNQIKKNIYFQDCLTEGQRLLEFQKWRNTIKEALQEQKRPKRSRQRIQTQYYGSRSLRNEKFNRT